MKEWLSQADAARLRGVSRQAISKLVQRGRLRTLTIGGHVFVHHDDAIGTSPDGGDEDNKTVADLKRRLVETSDGNRRSVFDWLREDQQLHPLEEEFGVPSEIILEAISRASDLTKHGVRGVIAEAMFAMEVVEKLDDWIDVALPGDHSFDFLLENNQQRVSIQLKMQRQKEHRPMTAREGYRKLEEDYWVVETQRTRGGKGPDGEDTRPYRFGEFDLLAVSLHPGTGNWKNFLFTVSDWLLPREEDASQLLKFQPVPREPDSHWTDDLEIAIAWLEKKSDKRISGLAAES
ncbi:MAG TPA: DNA-binding protein [Desulfobacterales bacterium]|nr:DNA-binding protein [Desulfobacterales bacterium]